MDPLMVKLFIGVVFGVICAVVAEQRGRSGVAWFFIGFLFSCIALVVLLVIQNPRLEEERHRTLQRENRRLRERVRKDRRVADERHRSVQHRLTTHDRALDLDTSRGLSHRGAPRELDYDEEEDAPPPPPLRRRTTRHAKQGWYYLVGDEKQGPVTPDALKALWRRGEINEDTMIWRNGWADWRAVRDVPGAREKLGG